MKNKTALITGSTSGIGEGIARHFASLGINIVLNGFGEAGAIKNLEKELKDTFNVNCTYIACDMSKPEEIENMCNRAIKEFGTIEILVNNAGIQHVSPIESFPVDKFENIIRINLISAFYTSKALIPNMIHNNFGRIINIASAHGLVASPFKSAYVAAKHGIVGFTKSVALEVAAKGITVNAICPGYVETPLVLGQVKDTAKTRGISEEEVIKNVMLGPQYTKKFIKISEVASLAGYLISDNASSITGAALTIDGGWTAH